MARSLRLAAVFAGTWLAAAQSVADEPAPGQLLYNKHCLSCHQADGGGVPNMQPPIAGGTWVKGDARALAMFVMSGGFDSASRKDGENHNVMPAFARLSDAEIAAILTFIRGKFGKGAPAVSESDVAEARKNLPPPQ